MKNLLLKTKKEKLASIELGLTYEFVIRVFESEVIFALEFILALLSIFIFVSVDIIIEMNAVVDDVVISRYFTFE